MKYSTLILLILFTSCSRPYYIKDKHFDSDEKEYQVDSDLKELIYKSLKRATVTEKDIPDYDLLWKKHRIYVLNAYQTQHTEVLSQEGWNENLSYLNPADIPNEIDGVSFCLKSREELLKIADRTWEDFLHISFPAIKIEDDVATIIIANSWIVSKHQKKRFHLSGGGYKCIYKKVNGSWEFDKIVSSWIS